MDKVVHFEIPVDDRERAAAFYESVFGWEMNHIPEMRYTIAMTTPIDEQQNPTEPGAINGGLMTGATAQRPRSSRSTCRPSTSR
jgi:predicted enzyme related to lactoylglutathione lyase